MPIPAQRDQEQSRQALTTWFTRTLGREVQLSEFRGPGATGFSNETLIVDVSWDGGESSYVVRVAPTGYSLFPDAVFDRQYRVLRALERTSVPVPTVRWYEQDAGVLGAPFFVMDEVQGRVPPDNPPYHMAGWLHDVSPEHRARVWWGAIDTIAELHRLDWKGLELEFLTGGLAEQLDYYTRWLTEIEKDEPVPMARQTLEWLLGHLPEDELTVLCWGDARVGNVMYDDDGNRLAVLDWEMVGLGAPAQDVAWALFLDRHHSEGVATPRLEGFPSAEETVARYEERSGIRLRDLEFYEVFAAFRFCVIMARLARIFKDWDLLPPDDAMAQDNTVTRLAEQVLTERRLAERGP
jgi:aminoglycoside phosphotransferase (APT) family kinase protein